eukprot:6857707-Pyramimonas_sp.AAC.1
MATDVWVGRASFSPTSASTSPSRTVGLPPSANHFLFAPPRWMGGAAGYTPFVSDSFRDAG